jgi:hypothetical protein
VIMADPVFRYFPPGIQGPQVDTAQPRGGIGMPMERLQARRLWDSPAIQSPPHNLPAPGDRMRPRGVNPIIGAGSGSGSSPSTAAPPNPTQLVRERHRYADVIETPFLVGVVSVRVLTAPAGLRNFLVLRNISAGAQVLFVSFGNVATLQSTLRLASNQAVLFDTVVPQNEINAISDIAGGSIMVAYSQYAPT